jgi:protoheme IX farnesyltransferase
VYFVAASLLGVVFLHYAYRLWREGTSRAASAVFKYSIVYLGLLFGAIALDGLVG